jgi:hypothetical protein
VFEEHDQKLGQLNRDLATPIELPLTPEAEQI